MKAQLLIIAMLIFTLGSMAQNKSKTMEALYYTKMLSGTYEEVFSKVESELKEIKFGIVTQVAMHEKIKGKLGKTIPIYQLLGVCSPSHAYDAMMEEDNIGLFLPCKVLIKEKGENKFEIVCINAVEMMGIIGNEKLNKVAAEVDESLKKFVDAL